MKILDEVSKILGVYTTAKSLDEDVRVLETSGRFTQRKVHELLVAIVKYLHDLEQSGVVQPIIK